MLKRKKSSLYWGYQILSLPSFCLPHLYREKISLVLFLGVRYMPWQNSYKNFIQHYEKIMIPEWIFIIKSIQSSYLVKLYKQFDLSYGMWLTLKIIYSSFKINNNKKIFDEQTYKPYYFMGMCVTLKRW